MKHPEGCKMQGCWVDDDGVAYHPGSAFGVYVIAKGWSKALFLVSSDFTKMDAISPIQWVNILEEGDNAEI